MTPALETSAGTSLTGCRFVAYHAVGWSAVAEEEEPGSGWWCLWLVPPNEGARRPLWPWGFWSRTYACGVAEHIARALVVMAEAVTEDLVGE